MDASHEDADRNETGRERFSLLLRGHAVRNKSLTAKISHVFPTTRFLEMVKD